MRGIIYQNDGEIIKIVDDNDPYHLPINLDKGGENLLLIRIVDSFGYNFKEFYKIDKLYEVIEEYDQKFGTTKIIHFIFNEIIIDTMVEFKKIEIKLDKKCYYSNYDLQPSDDERKIFLPLSLYSQVDFLMSEKYDKAVDFLKSMNRNYSDLKKPYKCVFLSNHISPIRIDIFNILKTTDNLKNSVWSFNTKVQYYSNEKHNISVFLKENENIIPFSHDGFSDKKNVLKNTYFSQFLTYFEVVTESYFFKDIRRIENHCPITEKLVKPMASFLPFIFFGSKNTKNRLMDMGMSFDCPLYGFYDNTDERSINEGMGHFTKQIIMSKNELHLIYFKYLNEFYNNSRIFFEYFDKLKLDIKEKIYETKKLKCDKPNLL